MKIKFTQKHINLFKRLGIQVIYLFGSRAEGKVHLLSDFDIGIVFEKPEKYKNNLMDVYLKLYDVFAQILPKSYLKQRFKLKENEFDIVFLQFKPISFQFEVIKSGKVLYEQNEETRMNYEEYIMKKQCDLSYFHNIHYQAILERI